MAEIEKGDLGHTLPETVYVTVHVQGRLRDRFPALATAPDKALIKLVSQEIAYAIRAGRVAKNEPRWLVRGEGGQRGKRGKRVKSRRNRFIWNEDLTRCYVAIRQTQPGTGKPQVIVKTVLVPQELGEAA